MKMKELEKQFGFYGYGGLFPKEAAQILIVKLKEAREEILRLNETDSYTTLQDACGKLPQFLADHKLPEYHIQGTHQRLPKEDAEALLEMQAEMWSLWRELQTLSQALPETRRVTWTIRNEETEQIILKRDGYEMGEFE